MIICIFFISLLVTIRSVRGFPNCDLYEFYTDKAMYYNDEQIQINATWNLQYALGDKCYNQIRIYNDTNYNETNIVWRSNNINELGQHSYTWTLWVQDLKTSFNNDYSIFYIKIYHYLESNSVTQGLLDETIQIRTIKRNVTCELEGFKNVIRYGEVLNLKATFYNTTGQNRIELENYQIHFKVSSKGNITFNRIYVTNSSGMIETISLNKSVVSIGVNFLSFTMKNDTFFNDLDYNLALVVTETNISPALSRSSDKDVNDGENGEYIEYVSIISIICLSFSFLGAILYKNYRRNQKQNLDDISFKY